METVFPGCPLYPACGWANQCVAPVKNGLYQMMEGIEAGPCDARVQNANIEFRSWPSAVVC